LLGSILSAAPLPTAPAQFALQATDFVLNVVQVPLVERIRPGARRAASAEAVDSQRAGEHLEGEEAAESRASGQTDHSSSRDATDAPAITAATTETGASTLIKCPIADSHRLQEFLGPNLFDAFELAWRVPGQGVTGCPRDPVAIESVGEKLRVVWLRKGSSDPTAIVLAPDSATATPVFAPHDEFVRDLPPQTIRVSPRYPVPTGNWVIAQEQGGRCRGSFFTRYSGSPDVQVALPAAPTFVLLSAAAETRRVVASVGTGTDDRGMIRHRVTFTKPHAVPTINHYWLWYPNASEPSWAVLTPVARGKAPTPPPRSMGPIHQQPSDCSRVERDVAAASIAACLASQFTDPVECRVFGPYRSEVEDVNAG
jgi:hypothetical protein